MNMGKIAHTTAVLAASAIAAKFVTERFVIKADENDPTGFIMQAEGFGLDDIATGVVFGLIGAVALGMLGPRS